MNNQEASVKVFKGIRFVPFSGAAVVLFVLFVVTYICYFQTENVFAWGLPLLFVQPLFMRWCTEIDFEKGVLKRYLRPYGVKLGFWRKAKDFGAFKIVVFTPNKGGIKSGAINATKGSIYGVLPIGQYRDKGGGSGLRQFAIKVRDRKLKSDFILCYTDHKADLRYDIMRLTSELDWKDLSPGKRRM